MKFDTILGISGVILTIILGYLGIKYTLKYRKKIDLIFLKNSSISLFETIVKNLDDIQITYKGNRIDENLILFKGTFFNNGNIDIEKNIVHKPLEISLPENYSWKSCKVIDSSDGLDITITQDHNKITFGWDLLKEGEYFTFDSLVELKSEANEKENLNPARSLIQEMKISHRITDLKEIKKENSIRKPMSIIGFIILSIFVLGLVFAMFYVSFGQYIFPEYDLYYAIKVNSAEHLLKFSPISANKIKLIDMDDKTLGVMQTDELINALKTTHIVAQQKINYLSLIFGGLLSVIYFVLWVLLLLVFPRDRSLYKNLKDVAEKHNDSGVNSRFVLRLLEFGWK